MSMLAERRRKTKWVLNPTKKPLWTTDSSGIQFGRDLMEKMGWSAGKGLGAKEQGIQEPLRVSYKHDTKGIGFKGNDNEWIEQQDEFNELLKNLRNDDHDGEAVETSESTKPELRSLEDKSKHSRARLHYQKLVRGKDLSKYSDTDLACILGINKKEKKEKTEETSEETPKTDADPNTETSFGVTTIRSGFIDDYFKKKYILSKTNKEGAENKSEGFTDSKSVDCTNERENEKSDVVEGSSKENKKRKKQKLGNNEFGTAEHDCESSRGNEFDFPQAEVGEKKSKKRKHKSNATEAIELHKKENFLETSTEEDPKVKKRKKKNSSINEINENDFENSNVEENHCKADDKSILLVSSEENKMVEAEEKKIKRKKHKLISETESAQEEESGGFEASQTDPTQEIKKRHKNKKKDVDMIEEKEKVKKKKTFHEKFESEEDTNLVKKEENQSICVEEAKDAVEEEDCMQEKKEKKRKHKSGSEGDVDIKASQVSFHFPVNNKGEKLKKKSKSEDETMEEKVAETCEAVESVGGQKEEKERKKRKKRSSTEECETTPLESLSQEKCENAPMENENENEISLTKKKKKKKKSEKEEIIREEDCLEENVEKKEKKRKSKSKDHANRDLTFKNKSEEMGATDSNRTSTGEFGVSEVVKSDKKKKEKNDKDDIIRENVEKVKKKEKKRKSKLKDLENLDSAFNSEDADMGTLDLHEIAPGEVEVPEMIKSDKKKRERKEKRKDREEAAESSEIDAKLLTKKKKSEKKEKVKLEDLGKAENCDEGNVNDLKEGMDGRKVTNEDSEAVGKGSKPSVSKTNNSDESVQYKTYTKQKVLDLICWADIKEFKGSNLGNVLGYGFKKEYIKRNTVR